MYTSMDWSSLCSKTTTDVLWIRNCGQNCLRAAGGDAAGGGGRCVCTQQMAAVFCVKGGHDHHLESMTSNRKKDSVSQCVFNWRTILPNFTPIRFETTAPYAFLKRWPDNNNKKMSRDMGSVPDLTSSMRLSFPYSERDRLTVRSAEVILWCGTP